MSTELLNKQGMSVIRFWGGSEQLLQISIPRDGHPRYISIDKRQAKLLRKTLKRWLNESDNRAK